MGVMTDNFSFPSSDSNEPFTKDGFDVGSEDGEFYPKFQKGNYLLSLGEYRGAAKIFFWLLDHYASNWELLHALAITLLNLNDVTRALTYFSILQEEYRDKCNVDDVISTLKEENDNLSEDHRFFISEQEHLIPCA